MEIRKVRQPFARGMGCPQNIFYENLSQGNIGGRAARATARVAPTGLHCLMCDRAEFGIK